MLPKLWETIYLRIHSPQSKEQSLPRSIRGQKQHGLAAFTQSEIKRAAEDVGRFLLLDSWKTDYVLHQTRLLMLGCRHKIWSTVTTITSPVTEDTWLLHLHILSLRVWWVRPASHTKIKLRCVLTDVILRQLNTESMLARQAQWPFWHQPNRFSKKSWQMDRWR